MRTPTMNAAAITRRVRAAGHTVVSHADPQRPGHVRVVPIADTPADAVDQAERVAELLRGAGYTVAPIQLGTLPADAVTVSLPDADVVANPPAGSDLAADLVAELAAAPADAMAAHTAGLSAPLVAAMRAHLVDEPRPTRRERRARTTRRTGRPQRTRAELVAAIRARVAVA